LLSGDVQVGIEWTLHEEARYEQDAAPDVDNILKPLLDAALWADRPAHRRLPGASCGLSVDRLDAPRAARKDGYARAY
jgi:hypothetical protein